MKTCHEQFIYSTGRHYPFRLGVKFNDNEEISGTTSATNDKVLAPGGIIGQAHHMFSLFGFHYSWIDEFSLLCFFYKVPSLNTQFCIKRLLVVRDFCFRAVWAAGPVLKKKLGRLWTTFEGGFFMFSWAKHFFKNFFENILASALKSCVISHYEIIFCFFSLIFFGVKIG